MKMTKIDTARKIIEQGNCMGISCKNCFTTRKECWDTAGNHRMIHLAEAYIKRYGRPKVKKPEPRKQRASEILTNGYFCGGICRIKDKKCAFHQDCKDAEWMGYGDQALPAIQSFRDFIDKEAGVTKKVEYVRCVKNNNVPLTAGKIYEVVKESEVGFNVVDDVGEKRDYYKYRFEPAEKPVVKENFTPEPMTIEEIHKAFMNKEKIYDVGDDYLNEIDLSKYDYLKIARDSITAESEGEVCLLVTYLKSTYKTHAEAYKVFASRR